MTVEQRFWSKVARGEADECWLWTGAVSSSGYGAFGAYEDCKSYGAHRFSKEMELGSRLPRHLYACHRCDNKLCVNPAHIFVGTARDNSQDLIQKGLRKAAVVRNRRRGDNHPSRLMPERLVRGALHPNAVLSERSILEIRSSRGSCAGLAASYGVSPVTISRIRRRKAWAHVG